MTNVEQRPEGALHAKDQLDGGLIMWDLESASCMEDPTLDQRLQRGNQDHHKMPGNMEHTPGWSGKISLITKKKCTTNFMT